jgi:hypothetical protein
MITDPAASRPATLTPASVDISQYSETPRTRAVVTIENRSEEDLRVAPVDTAFKSVTIELPDKIKAGSIEQITIEVRPEAVETEFKESITFIVGGKTQQGIYTIPIKRQYKPI